ncbi:MAG TPA: hypothetical protein VF088_05020, partial [Pyrinomonadaceae bacterium]
DEASMFRYLSMDALRQARRHDEPGPSALHSLYHLLSGYGERIGRAFLVLIFIWLLFGVLYILTGHIKLQGYTIGAIGQGLVRALNHSLQVLTLQRTELSKGIVTPFLVTLEMVVGPLQIALLALAVRRQFMR